MRNRIRNERGTALIETAITLPLVLLVCVAIFEFGRAYQTWQILTNAAREGARVGVISGTTDDQIRNTVRAYITNGAVGGADAANINVSRNVAMGASTATSVNVQFPFSFIVLNPVARLVTSSSNVGAPVTMQASAIMRNE